MPTKAQDIERRHFEQLVEEAGDFNPFQDRAWRLLEGCFDAAVAPRSQLDVLDIGCGTGRSSTIYRRRQRSYIGLDLALTGLRLARQRLPALRWVEADAIELPIGDQAVDVVAFSSVLHHLPDRLPALREALRVLRPGGVIFAFDPNLLHPPMALFRHPASPLYISQGVSPLERPLLGRALRRDFAAAGCADVEQFARSGLPYRAVAPPLLNAGLALYNVCDQLLQLSGLGRWLGSFLITVGRRPPRPLVLGRVSDQSAAPAR